MNAMNERLIDLCREAKDTKYYTAKLTTDDKDHILRSVAQALIDSAGDIVSANSIDCENGIKKGMPQGLLDRLKLDEARIRQMALGLEQVAGLEDPIGQVLSMKKRPNGLLIGQKRVPIGVVGVIYEARPNVTADVFALCFKTGNVCILKGGSDAINSNKAIVKIIQEVLVANNMPAACINLIEDTDRDTAMEFMKLHQYVDVLIPRGGAGLIRSVVENATIPVIETGTGNCHIYVDETADTDMAVNIINNAKTQRIGVCNACESLVVHEAVAEKLLPVLAEKLSEHSVEIRGDRTVTDILGTASSADEDDWGREYLDYIISIKTVSNIDEAIDHINKYNTGHSEAIITKDYNNAQKFLDEIDAACVYVNASTRFTDGFEFGFGAEIGISTQKLHARGPMGLIALTSTKYIIYGDGQVRS